MYNINWNDILEEAKKYLSELIQINTTNPPGNELLAANYLQNILQKEGISAKVITSEENRGNIIARIEGESSKGGLLLLSHLDVVPAEENKWEIPPFSGKIKDNHIWGRGALDCKSLVVQQLMILLIIKRYNIRLKRKLIFASTADEERGGEKGINYLLCNFPDEFDVQYAINEGGGACINIKGKRFYLCQVAEKGLLWIKIKSYGTASHASVPTRNNATVKISRIVDKLSKYNQKIILTKTTENMIKNICNEFKIPYLFFRIFYPFVNFTLSKIGGDGLNNVIRAILTNTFTPTVIRAGEKINVVPSEAYVEVDGRILPDQQKDKILLSLKKYLAKFKSDIEVIEYHPATESDISNPLFSTIQNVMKKHDNGAVVLPFMLTGATDSRFLRRRGIVSFGFSPYKVERDYSDYFKMIHGHNERISFDNLLFGIKTLFDITVDICQTT